MGLCASAAPVKPDAPPPVAKNYYAQQAAKKAERQRGSREWASWDSHRGLAHVVHGFAMATATSSKSRARDAVLEAYAAMDKRLALPTRGEKGATVMHDVTADILFVFASPEYSAAAISDALVECAPSVPIHGCSSSQGVFGWDGLYLTTSEDGSRTSGGIAIMGIADDEGTYATNAQGFDNHESVETAAITAARACQSKLKTGVDLSAAFITCSAGTADRVIKAVRTVLGNVPLVGGSAGVGVDGFSSQFSELDSFTSGGVVISLMQSTATVESRIVWPYEATDSTGVATKVLTTTPSKGASVCLLHEIDGKRACDIFASWCEESVRSDPIWGEGKEGDIRALSASNPMRVTPTGTEESFTVECLRKNSDGSLTLSAPIDEGCQLKGQRHVDPSEERIARKKTSQAVVTDILSEVATAGALIVFSDEYRRFTTGEIKSIQRHVNGKDSNMPYCGMFAGQQISSIKSESDCVGVNSLAVQITLFKKKEK